MLMMMSDVFSLSAQRLEVELPATEKKLVPVVSPDPM